MNSDISTAFSVDEDISFIYNKIKKNDSYVYKIDEDSDIISTGIDDHNIDVNENGHEIIDVKTEKKYSYGIATVYIIVILLMVNTLLSNITNYKKKGIEDTFLDNYKHISNEIDGIKRENELLNQKLSEMELDITKKSNDQKLYDDIHKRQNYMNYKYGTQLIKEKTSESCQKISKVIATDLLSPLYINDNTLNWECKYDTYCSLGIHFHSPVIIDRIIYEYGNIKKNIERIKVYYEFDDDLIMYQDHFCENSNDYEIIQIQDRSINVQSIVIHFYSVEKNISCLPLNNLIVNTQ